MKKALVSLVVASFLCVAGSAHAADSPSGGQTLGTFAGCYLISSDLAGGPTLHLPLTFSSEDHFVNGQAQVTEALQQPAVLKAKVNGFYLKLFILHSPYFVIQGNGYPDLHWPPGGGVGPVLLPTLEFHFNTPTSFSFGGQKGELPSKGKFRYRSDMLGEWSPWFEGQVEVTPCPLR